MWPKLTVLLQSTEAAAPTVPRCLCGQPCLLRTPGPWPAGVTQQHRSCWLWGHLGAVGAAVTSLPSGTVSLGQPEEGKRGHQIRPMGWSLELPGIGENSCTNQDLFSRSLTVFISWFFTISIAVKVPGVQSFWMCSTYTFCTMEDGNSSAARFLLFYILFHRLAFSENLVWSQGSSPYEKWMKVTQTMSLTRGSQRLMWLTWWSSISEISQNLYSPASSVNPFSTSTSVCSSNCGLVIRYICVQYLDPSFLHTSLKIAYGKQSLTPTNSIVRILFSGAHTGNWGCQLPKQAISTGSFTHHPRGLLIWFSRNRDSISYLKGSLGRK